MTKHTGKTTSCLQSSCSLSLSLTFGIAYSHFAEAMDFRDWCESESVRLTGTKGILLAARIRHQAIAKPSYLFHLSKL